MNKKIVNIILLMVVLISLFSVVVESATIAEGFRAGLNTIENFFKGGWQNYERTITFVVFFFLFFSAYLIGAKKAFSENGKLGRPHMVFAFVAALLSALIVISTMKFDWVNLKYVACFLIGVLILFLIYSVLLKIGFEKHKFWAFIIALIIGSFLILLICGLMGEGKSFGKMGGWFEGLGKTSKKGGISLTDPTWPGGVPPVGKDETLQKVTPEEGGWFTKTLSGTPMWVLALILAIIGTTFGAGSVGKLRGKGFFGGIKDFYGYPFGARKGAYKQGINWVYKKRLEKLIDYILKILEDPKLTEKERRDVELRLKQAIKTVDQIDEKWINPRIDMFKKYKGHLTDLKNAKI